MPAVGGHGYQGVASEEDLQRLGIPPGRRLGQILQTLLDHVLDDPTQNSRVRLLALAQAEWDLPPHRATD